MKSGQKRPLHFRVASRFKRLVQATRYKKSPYVARTALRGKTIRKPIISNILKLISKECIRLCRKKGENTIFRLSSMSALKKLKVTDFTKELRRRAPILYTVVKRACTRSRAKIKKSNVATIAAALLLKGRNKTMCSPQAIISILLYAGHCSKMVSYRTFFALHF